MIMNEKSGKVDWRNIKDINLVFDGEGDCTVRPITDPKMIKAMERVRDMYREALGLEDDESRD